MKTKADKTPTGRIVFGSGTPYPGCFGARVWIWLILKELMFLATTKSSEECVGKGVSCARSMLVEVIRSANMTHSIR